MNEIEHDDAVGEMIVALHVADPMLRKAFASALGAIMQSLPPGIARDLAIMETMSAHARVEKALARHRVLN